MDTLFALLSKNSQSTYPKKLKCYPKIIINNLTHWLRLARYPKTVTTIFLHPAQSVGCIVNVFSNSKSLTSEPILSTSRVISVSSSFLPKRTRLSWLPHQDPKRVSFLLYSKYVSCLSLKGDSDTTEFEPWLVSRIIVIACFYVFVFIFRYPYIICLQTVLK